MAGRLIIEVAQPALDSNGNLINGSTLEFYDAVTLAPKNVFSSSALTTSLGNVVTASGGFFPEIWAADGEAYRVVWKNASGSVLRTMDNMTAQNNALSSRIISDFSGTYQAKLQAALSFLAADPENLLPKQGFSIPISSTLTLPSTSFSFDGAGINRSNITRSGAGGIPFAFGPQHSGSKLVGLSITAASGSSGGSALSIVATAGGAPSKFAFDDLYLTTLQTDGWANTIVLDGSLKTTEPSGIREAMFTNVSVFGSANWSFDGSGLRSVYGFGLNLYPAGGTITTPSATQSGGLRLTGPVGMPSEGCFLKGSDVGRILFDRTLDCTAWFDSIAYDATITANAQNSLIFGTVYGTPSCASLTSGIVQPADFARNWNDSSGWIGLPGGGMLQWVDVAVGTTFTSFSWPRTFAARPTVFGGNGRSGSYTAIVFHPTLTTAVTTTGGQVATQTACDARIWAIGRTW